MRALRHGEVLLAAIALDNKEASRLCVFRVSTDLDVRQILLLLLCPVVELEQLNHERAIRVTELLTVLDVVEDGARLRLDLVDVHVELTGDGIRLFLTSGTLLSLLLLGLLRQLFGNSLLGRRAVMEMSSLLLPEFRELIILEFRECELFATDLFVNKSGQFLILLLIVLVAGDGHLTLVFVGTRVHDLQGLELGLDEDLEVLPVHLVLFVLFLILILGREVDNQRVFEILADKYDAALLVSDDGCALFLRFDLLAVGGFRELLLHLILAASLGFTLSKGASLLGQRHVINSAHAGFGLVKLERSRCGESVSEDRRGLHTKLLDIVTVEERSELDVAILVGSDSFSEEIVTRQVSVAEVVLELLQQTLTFHDVFSCSAIF